MSSEAVGKINRLLQSWPRGTVALQSFFTEHGVSQKLAARYRKSGWIDPVGRGAFVRRGDKVGWEGAVYALQRYAGKPIRPGGRTALELHGYAHFLRMGSRREVHLFGPPGERLPRWMMDHDWGADLRYFGTTLFSHPVDAGQKMVGELTLSVSSPERAILEVLDGVPRVTSFEEARLLMEGLPSLRPRLIQQLLEACTTVKVKRLCLHLADATQMPWRGEMNESRIDLGSGKRQVVEGGRLDSRYNITVPRESKQ
jgi:Transcriptional regulator, AbiEi antitoxin, Type IV TA system/Transcriptional regulator, AbiEi antitoxin N-terminal domain